MNKEQFWQLISEMMEKDETSDWLIEQLASRSTSEIADYEIHFQTAFKESYTSSLWAAAYIILGGCSDDSFDYFRGWLIACGQEVFESAMQNPDNLANLIPSFYEEEEIIPEFEEMLSVALEAFSLKETGDIEWDDDIWDKFDSLLDEKGHDSSMPDIEFDWDEDDEEGLAKRFPKLWKRFGENPLG
ncbi:DUF4240 domain-containing protein [Bacillus sp. Xin]|uniref:DUF4240 domain-containing protein n=1 Tax=unclassified Bacillus (in: firmicutes) TaxID=185979 RepID=UPI001573D5C7|nr:MULTISPECIES: DUF4240 domain-containing protein [unclassified Bacillus (in: firmicutes)]MBC6975818.1 DUF4240 domain-containing protein [Bacillus sp. Xin]MCI0764756.1 DUF4240 domain-containing protein [Bacillus sp. TL12]NSW35179.1 DUF4240 domain-containing protein [Bacillus sp. Xin1]